MKRGGGGEFWRRGVKYESLNTGGQERGEVFLIIIPNFPKKHISKKKRICVQSRCNTIKHKNLKSFLFFFFNEKKIHHDYIISII